MKKYIFRKYDPKYLLLFRIEKVKLKKILPKAKIEHIGSSAVPGLGGKGIIDILIGVNKKEIIWARNKLQERKYTLKPKAGSKERLFFEKDYKYSGKMRRVHLQLTHFDSQIWKNSIKVRDILKKDSKERKKYSELKKKAVKFAKGEGRDYRKYKNNYLFKLTKR
jgi:GrpB-like predicted nucleotidyltransferase (UPF0157 family)